MIAYNPKDWFTFIFKMHKADTIRKLFVMIICISIYSGIIAWLELEFWDLSAKPWAKEIHALHSLLGLVLSLLLVFRTNSAYDRWWEGRKLWGSLVNSSRNLAIKMHSILPDSDAKNRKYFRKSIPFYAKVLAIHLSKDKTRLELDEDTLEITIDKTKHLPNQVAKHILTKVQSLYQSKTISETQLLTINQELTNFTDVCGACERIKNTPIPFSYNLFIKKFIFFYVMTLPFGFVFKLGYFVIALVAFVFYVLASLEIIAEEIEDPFSNDTNDVPTEKIATNIDKNVNEILG